MALNRKRERATQLSLPVPEGTESGDALVLGALPCVALIDRQADGTATVQTDGSFDLVVKANEDISVGEILFLQGDGDIDADEGGTRFGYALESLRRDAETLIEVKIGY